MYPFRMILQLLTALLLVCGCISYPPQTEEEVLFELPTILQDDIIIRYHNNYVVSYNEDTKVANWVAYELKKEELSGTGDRKTMRFVKDSNVNVSQASDEDYRGSMWRKGHLAPAADFKTDDNTMLDTFFFTNCAPQNDKFNNSKWNQLEDRVRGWARHYGSIYVVTGPIIGDNIYGTLGNSHIVIPDAYFKALCIYHNEQYRTVAFVMENSSDCPHYKKCVFTINDLELITGINFYPSLSEEAENSVDYSFWGL